MKILSWNCKGAYRKKHESIFKVYAPDIWVIQECECPENLVKEKSFELPKNHVWYGDNPNRGISVFAKEGINLRIIADHNPSFRYVIPVEVYGDVDFYLMAVWAMDNKLFRKQRYIGQVYSAIDHYFSKIDHNTIIAGDFNWNVNFVETGNLTGNLNDVIDRLQVHQIISAYHQHYGEVFGKESMPTLYFRGKEKDPFHIDYIFAHKKLCERGSVVIGKWKDWYQLSDHMPVCFEFETFQDVKSEQ